MPTVSIDKDQYLHGMRPFTLLLTICSFTYAFGQNNLQQPIPELPTITLAASGFNPDSIGNLLSFIGHTPPNDFRGLVVIKNNQLVLEEYFHTFWRNSIHDIRSAGKSITALLLGIALREGLVQSLDQDLSSFFPKSKYPFINENYKKIKLRHLLNMSSGLDADSDNPGTIGHAVNWVAKDDWKAFLLQVPLIDEPGERWVYADINALLIGVVIEETSGQSLSDFAQEKLFDPLGIKQYYWYTTAANQTGAAGNLYLTTLDFAKLGTLLVNEGKWKNKQLIELDYIQELSIEAFDLSTNNPFADTYGMFWYKSRRTFGNKTVNYLFASGNGGNHLVVIPEEEMVIALTSSAYGQRYAHRRSYTILSKIVAALE